MVLDPANGVTKREGGCLLLQHVRSSGVEEHDWEASVHTCENGGSGGVRPVIECKFIVNFCNRTIVLCTPCILGAHVMERSLRPGFVAG